MRPSIKQSRVRLGGAAPDPFRLSDMMGDLLHEAQETIFIIPGTAPWTDHPKQDEARKADYIERWIISGNRFGKSDWGARESRYWMLGDHPYLSHRISLPSKGWAVSDTLDNSREILLPKLLRHIPYEAIRRFPTRENRDLELTCGSIISLKSCEQGRGAFQGQDKDFIWFDDIEGANPLLAEICYKEASMRIGAGRNLYKWGTMTPVCGMTALMEQLLAREGEIYILRGTIHDNPHLGDGAKAAALAGLTEDWEIKAREEGVITLMGGSYYFDPDLTALMLEKPEPNHHICRIVQVDEKTFQFDSTEPIQPDELTHSKWKVFQYPKPNRRYVLSIDPAGGDLSYHADWTLLKVFDVQSGFECAVLRAKIGPTETAIQAKQAGYLYNLALVGIEMNAMGLGVADNMREYPRLYRRHNISDVDPKQGAKIGWYTSEALKEKMCRDLKESLMAGLIIINEKETWREMSFFVRNDKGHLGARRGKHDDGVTCTALGGQLLLAPSLEDFFTNMVLA